MSASPSSSTAPGTDILQQIRERQDRSLYQDLHWEGSFTDYLELVRQRPQVARNAFQRLYDMVVSFGVERHTEYKKEILRYRFFADPIGQGKDAVYGLDLPLMKLMQVFKAAAMGYGPERRVILLHGPVGSSKSTICRLIKKGLEHYSRTPDGALYTFSWVGEGIGTLGVPPELVQGHVATDQMPCPLHEEPLKLLPSEFRQLFLDEINQKRSDERKLHVEGELCPACRYIFNHLMLEYDGDYGKVVEHVRVRRMLVSEADRIGIGTFQPKDEKNQDSTELTGDINYRKIAIYGSDSDPRSFNFDGEFCVANRGMIEFIEVLKLDVAFLYDLLGASQEHKIKPKKFAQTDVDEVIVAHSVSGGTPIPYRYQGQVGWTTLEGLHARFAEEPRGLEVLAYDFDASRAAWTPVRSLFRHRYAGEVLTTSQKWGAVETTWNHSIYDRHGEPFYPEQQREVMAVRQLAGVLEPRPLELVDAVAGVPGFVREDALVTASGGEMTVPCREGWARLDLPRHATEVRALYDPLVDVEPLRDLLTVLVWYATEGHVNGRNGGIVLSQKDRAELERVRAACARITSGRGSIDAGAKSDSAWRLYLGSQAIARLAVHHCGRGAANKRLPDFLFQLPQPYLQHAFDELMRTDGTRKLPPRLEGVAGEAYRERYFQFRTISPLLAAQVGTLASLLGHDYGVYRQERGERAPAYGIRFVSGEGKRGGRHRSFHPRLHRRPAEAEWMYDVECIGLHNFVCGVGNVVAHNTNEPEYKRLQNNEFMEALRDRTIKINIPYVTRLEEEIHVYERDFNNRKIRGKHIAPHTIEIAAMWAVLTRLEEPKKINLSRLQKLKLYNGKSLPGFTEDNIKELRKEAHREGMEGISPRYVQDKLSNCLVADIEETCVNPFMVMKELESGLRHHSLINNEELKEKYRELLAVVREEYEDIVKNEVQRAISGDEEALSRLCANYIDNVKAYTQRERVRNKYTGDYEEPDERLMRSIEEKIDIPESRKDDFRREIMNYIGALAVDGKRFRHDTNARLHKALELKLFEDQKDSIKLTSLVSNVLDQDAQEKIDVVKTRLIQQHGYCHVCATDVLTFVASIFARGDVKR